MLTKRLEQNPVISCRLETGLSYLRYFVQHESTSGDCVALNPGVRVFRVEKTNPPYVAPPFFDLPSCGTRELRPVANSFAGAAGSVPKTYRSELSNDAIGSRFTSTNDCLCVCLCVCVSAVRFLPGLPARAKQF